MASSGQRDGGPAFPQRYTERGGMSLRQWYAGMALANPHLGQAYHLTPDALAKHAYEYADALLAEGDRPQDSHPVEHGSLIDAAARVLNSEGETDTGPSQANEKE